MGTGAVRQALQVRLSVRHGRAAAEHHRAAFGAEEAYRSGGTDDHEDLDCQLAVGGAVTATAGGSTERLLMIVDEIVDAPGEIHARAAGLGAREISLVAEEHGWLLGRIDDPFGHRWEIGRPLGPWPPAPRAPRGGPAGTSGPTGTSGGTGGAGGPSVGEGRT